MVREEIEVNYEILETVQARFTQCSESLGTCLSRLDNQVETLRSGWVGRGADAFFAEWESDVRPRLQRLVESQDESVTAVRKIIAVMSAAEDDASAVFRGDAGGRSRGGGVGGNAVSSGQPQPINPGDVVDGGMYMLMPNGDLVPFTGQDAGVVFVNGINTDGFGFRDAMKDLQAKYPGQPIVGVYNKTDSFFGDIGQAIRDRIEADGFFNSNNRATEQLVALMQSDLADGKLDMDLNGYSQGGAIVAAALHRLQESGVLPHEMSDLNVTTYGSAGTDYPYGPSYRHVVHGFDIVPLLSNAANLFTPDGISDAWNYYGNLEITYSLDHGFPFDLDYHGFKNYIDLAITDSPTIPSITETVTDVTEGIGNAMGDFADSVWDAFGG